MHSKVEKLFNDKLRNHTITPAPESWDKVEARLSKKNSVVIVMRVAAGITLAGLATLAIIGYLNKDEASPALASEKATVTTPVPAIDEKVTSVPAEPMAKTETVKKQPAPQRTPQKIQKVVTPEATLTTEPVVIEVQEQDMIATVQQEVKTKKIVLVYTLPTIAAKEGAPALAQGEEKKTGFQKVMDVAMEVRGSDNPIGELREAKDDLFALEFKKDKKTKNQ